MIGGEFGRTPAVEVSGLVKVQNGRDHNSHGFSTVVAGGGVKARLCSRGDRRIRLQGRRKARPYPRSARDLLHLLGLDHTKLTIGTAAAISG